MKNPNHEQLVLTRNDIAQMLNISVKTVERQEGRLGLKEARINVSDRTILYSVAVLEKLDWWKKLNA